MTMTNRKTVIATMLAALAAAPLAIAPVQVQAQAYPQPQAPVSHFYSQAELDQMLAPIALYPDALLSQVLMAATYPIEVTEAARWTRANPGLQGDDAVRAVQGEDWDPSVKSLVAFPEILQRMEERPEWTQALGDAFLAQEPQVMDEVQRLRHRAQSAGHLRSSEQIRVVEQGPVIVLQPASPDYFYVPYYDPLEVYGTWWWPSYRPVYWAPWPGYVRPRSSYAFWWGRPVGLSVGFFFGNFDWRQRYVRVAYPNSYYYRAPAYSSRTFVAGSRWQHDPQHRRGMDYRQAEVRQRFSGAQFERRADRQPSQFQAQPGARTQFQAQPGARTQFQAQPQTATPAPSVERRADRRDDRRAERQFAPAMTPAQPRPEQRDDRRAERQAAMEAQRQAYQQAQQQQARQQARQAQDFQRQAQQQQQARQAQDFQRQAQQQQARQQAQESQRQAQQQARQQAQAARQEQRAAAQAPQQPRAERREQRQERREHRGEHEKG